MPQPILVPGIQGVTDGSADDPMDDDRTSRDLTCRELADFVMAYLDDELALAERSAFEGHLAECPQCIAYLRSYRATVALGKTFGAADAAAAPAMPEELVQAILAARRDKA